MSNTLQTTEEQVLNGLNIGYERRLIKLSDLTGVGRLAQVRTEVYTDDYKAQRDSYGQRFLDGSEYPPIIVEASPADDGKFLVLAGNTRVSSAQNLGDDGPERMDAFVVLDHLSQHQRRAVGFRENRDARIPVSPDETAAAVRASASETGVSRDVVASDFAISRREVDRILDAERIEGLLLELGVQTPLRVKSVSNGLKTGIKTISLIKNREVTRVLPTLVKALNNEYISQGTFYEHTKALRDAGHDQEKIYKATQDMVALAESAEKTKKSGNGKLLGLRTPKTILKMLVRVANLKDQELEIIAKDEQLSKQALKIVDKFVQSECGEIA